MNGRIRMFHRFQVGIKNGQVHVLSDSQRGMCAEKPEAMYVPSALAFSSQNFLSYHMKCSHPSQILPGPSVGKHPQSENSCVHDQNQ